MAEQSTTNKDVYTEQTMTELVKDSNWQKIGTAEDGAKPANQLLVQSLAADYLADRLPQEARERIEDIREEFYQRHQDRLEEVKEGVLPDMQAFARDFSDAMADYQQSRPDLVVIDGEMASDMLPRLADPMHEMIDSVDRALEVSVEALRDNLDLANEMLDVRAANDPDGRYAELVGQARAQQEAFSTAVDNVVDDLQQRSEAAHAEVDLAADYAANLDQPINISGSRTLNPDGLNDETISTTGQGEA